MSTLCVDCQPSFHEFLDEKQLDRGELKRPYVLEPDQTG